MVLAVTDLCLSAGPPVVDMLFPIPEFFGKLGFAGKGCCNGRWKPKKEYNEAEDELVNLTNMSDGGVNETTRLHDFL